MYLTDQEQSILAGREGPVKQKAMRTLVRYGETFAANRLCPVSRGHVVMPAGASFLGSYLEILKSMVDDGLQFQVPTSINPRPFEKAHPGIIARRIYNRQDEFENLMQQLNVIPCYTCTPYFADNCPREGETLGWAESSAVVFANSVLGARTNRNSSLVEICSSILGLTPEFGFLLDENRQADYLVEVAAHDFDYSLLGFVVGQQVGEAVPYYRGFASDPGWGNLKDLGAASAASGAVGLFHVEGVTPEAKKEGDYLLKKNYRVIKVTDDDLKQVRNRLALRGKPNLVIIGCPHLSLEQLKTWAAKIDQRVQVETWLVTAPNLLQQFKETPDYERLIGRGVKFMTLCSLAFMDSPHLKRLRVLTNSGKLSYYTAACYGTDQECLRAIRGKAG